MSAGGATRAEQRRRRGATGCKASQVTPDDRVRKTPPPGRASSRLTRSSRRLWTTRTVGERSPPIEITDSVAERPASIRAIDGHHELVDALVAGGELGPPAGTVDAPGATLDADEHTAAAGASTSRSRPHRSHIRGARAAPPSARARTSAPCGRTLEASGAPRGEVSHPGFGHTERGSRRRARGFGGGPPPPAGASPWIAESTPLGPVIQTPAANEECDAPTPPQTRRKGWRKAASSQGRRTTSILQTRARSGYPPFEV
ncbi:MAG: hypothetical protein K0S82_682, partial [Gaiellaceae bacterium]|nr:hypothetical protein [Gaiellaceae bacterium]